MSMDKISDKDAAMVLRQGADEIDLMRQELRILRAKAEVIDVFKMALSGERSERCGYAEDAAWKLRKAADAIDSREKDE